MCESSEKFTPTATQQQLEPAAIRSAILEAANMGPVQTSDPQLWRFAAVTFSAEVPVLLTLQLTDGVAKTTANSEKMVVNSMLLKTVRLALTS